VGVTGGRQVVERQLSIAIELVLVAAALEVKQRRSVWSITDVSRSMSGRESGGIELLV